MATAAQIARDMDTLRLELVEYRKSTPTLSAVHINRPLGDKHKDDPADGELNPDPINPGLEDGIQDPFDYRNLDENHIPKTKDEDDPGTQDVDPPNQRAIDTAPLDVIVPQTVMKTISGSSDISLNAKGITLAKKLAERIHAKGCLDILYSSTLPRGIETVQPILEACPRTIYAEATAALVPWKLGAYEGREPKDVHNQIVALIEHPDEVPPGDGNDGEPGESFNASKSRQLSFFRKVMQDWRDDPTLKIGVQVHSRGEDLFVAWVKDGAPDDYDVDTEDVIDPDDQPHASVMRWAGKDEVKEVDLDSDDQLKGGVYLVLHSLTNDDGDDGNPELEKNDGRVLYHGTSAPEFETFNDKPTYLTDEAEHALMFAHDPIMGGGEGAGGIRTLRVRCAPGTSMDLTPWTQPEFDKGTDGDVDGVVARMGAQALADGHSYVEFDHPTAHHDTEGTFRSVVSLKPVRDLKIEKYEGQPRDDKGKFGAGVKLGVAQDMHDKLKDHAGRSPNPSQTAEESFAHGITMLGDRARELAGHAAFNVKINRSGDNARSVMIKHVNRGDAMRRSAIGADKAWHNDLALSHYHDALLTASRVLGSKWVGKSTVHVAVERMYMPPIEVHRAAKSAWDAGTSVIGITEALADSRGLDLAHVQAVADFFAASESATVSPLARNAYGGVNAAKWAAKVIAKSERVWESWIGCDFDGTLVQPSASYDGTAIGRPIPKMVAKVKAAIAAGKKVRIFTARVADDPKGLVADAIKVWTREHIGQELLVTNEKDPGLVEIWDDRAVNPDDIAKAGSGVMIAFMLDDVTAKSLAVPGGEDPKDMHVTLAYLGKLDKIDMSALPGLEQAIKSYAAEHAPISGTIDGPIRFSAKPQTEGRDVCVAAFCNPGIQEFRAGLVDAIKAAGIDVPRVFDYRPHVCIKYIPVDAAMPVQRIAPMPVTFSAITLSVGGARKSYPLSGSVVKYSPDQARDDHGRFGTADAMSPPHGGFISPEGKYTAKDISDTHDSLAHELGLGSTSNAIKQGYVRHVLSGGQNNYEAAKSAASIKLVLNHIRNLKRDDVVTVDINPGTNVHAMYGTAPEIRQRLNAELGKVGKYSPDQPRDDHGRWGAGDHAGVQRDRIRAVLNASDSDPKVKEAEERNLTTGDSRLTPGVLDDKGRYTPEAHAENKRIAEGFLNPDAKPPAGEKPSAIFMVGKPGAGKSTTLANLKGTLPTSVTINSDDIKEKLNDYTTDQAASYHERSCDIARSYLTPDAIRGGYNIVFDMTDNSERLMQSVDALKGAGYKVALIHSDVSDATSAERVYNRFKESGRYVPVRVALSYSGRPKLAYDLVKTHVDQYREYDQNGKRPRLTDSGGGGVF